MTSKLLSKALEVQELKTRRDYFHLSDAHKAIVEADFRGHILACRKAGIRYEFRFLPELIGDIKTGIYFEEVGMAVGS